MVPRKKREGKPPLGPGQRSLIKSERRAVRLFGADLQDAREEMFVRMVADGLSMGVSYVRAGFVVKTQNAAGDLFRQPHIQARIEAVLEARRTQGVVTLPEVTDMLKRVFAGANSEGEYSAAHNAAFSLARLYGHVTDKATLEVLRKPSREPDAPSEQVLGDWVAGLPGPVIEASPLSPPLEQGSKGPPHGAPAPLLGLGTMATPPSGPEPSGLELLAGNSASPEKLTAVNSGGLPNDFNGLAAPRDGDGIGNGAPVGPVTGTPRSGGRAPLLKKRVPLKRRKVPVKKRGKAKARALKIPSAKDLFG
jgi:hypothetical protein